MCCSVKRLGAWRLQHTAQFSCFEFDKRSQAARSVKLKSAWVTHVPRGTLLPVHPSVTIAPMKMLRPITFFALLAASVPVAFGAAADDTAVIHYCGAPLSTNKALSPATNEFTEDFFYPDDVVLHFLPMNGGWQLTSGWMRHIPVTRDGVAKRMPCVQEALSEVEHSPRPEIDPTIASQTVSREARRGFGIPFLWLIFALGITLAIYAVVPTPRKKLPERPEPRILHRMPDVVVQERIRQSSASRQVARPEE